MDAIKCAWEPYVHEYYVFCSCDCRPFGLLTLCKLWLPCLCLGTWTVLPELQGISLIPAFFVVYHQTRFVEQQNKLWLLWPSVSAVHTGAGVSPSWKGGCRIWPEWQRISHLWRDQFQEKASDNYVQHSSGRVMVPFGPFSPIAGIALTAVWLIVIALIIKLTYVVVQTWMPAMPCLLRRITASSWHIPFEMLHLF